jgi:hypothetical protein
LKDEESEMRRLFRGSVLALVAALCIGAAWQPGAIHRSAKLKPHRLAELAQPANPGKTPLLAEARRGELQTSPNPGDAPRQLAGCADPLTADAAESRRPCLAPGDLLLTGLDRASDGPGISLDAMSLGALALGFPGDPGPIDLISFAPSAAAAPTPEISTAGMLTLGLAGVAWIGRKTRRAKAGARENRAVPTGAILSVR